MAHKETHEPVITGRHLYKSVTDKSGSYDVALDENYALLCPWENVRKTGETRGKELSDPAVSVFASEEQN